MRTRAEPDRASTWRREPFRVFFPLGVVLAWVGIGHWLLYATGATRSYSCLLHGVVQMQAFMMAFAVGFLLTALPRRTESAPPAAAEMVIVAGALVGTAAAAVTERWALAQAAYAAVFLVLLRFAGRRLAGVEAARRPPAAFVLVPIAVAHGLAGAALIAAAARADAPSWAMPLGRLCVEQGVFLCLIVGVGALVLPLVAGAPPPPDLGTPAAGRAALVGYAGIGVAVFATLVLEQAGFARGGPLARAAVVTIGLARGAGAWRPPVRPGVHRRLVWLAVWLVPAGLAFSAAWPDYRIPALHVTFIGGFGLLAFAVATHVALGHLGLAALAEGRPRAVVFLGATLVLAMLARVAADWSDTYFDHLGWAAGLWLAGTAVWLAFLGPRLLRRG
jgi:uncharacterized protein involved in response to NO